MSASFPKPEPGLVIAYSYLWKSEAMKGQKEGRKDGRPCLILFTHRDRVFILPITHSRPIDDPTSAIEIPPQVRAAIGLDFEPQWVILSECNSFIWPGYDVRVEPQFGRVPPRFHSVVKEAVQARIATKTLKIVGRDLPAAD